MGARVSEEHWVSPRSGGQPCRFLRLPCSRCGWGMVCSYLGWICREDVWMFVWLCPLLSCPAGLLSSLNSVFSSVKWGWQFLPHKIFVQLRKIAYVKFLLNFGCHVNKKYWFSTLGYSPESLIVAICTMSGFSDSWNVKIFLWVPKLIFFIPSTIKYLLLSIWTALCSLQGIFTWSL